MMPWIVENALPWVWRASWQGAVLVGVILAIQILAGRRLSPQWRYALWGVLVVRLALVWTPTASFSLYNVAEWTVERTPIRAAAERPAAPLPEPAALDMSLDPAASSQSVLQPEHTEQGTATAGLGRFEMLVVLWLAGAVLLTGMMVFQAWRLTRRVSEYRPVTRESLLNLLESCKEEAGVRAWLAVVETPRVQSPALLGCLRPRLLLPVGLIDTASDAQLRHVFLHELAHIKRGDIWIGWLVNLLVAMHWFNPVLWWARKRIAIDREQACDATVLGWLRGDDQVAYGHTMLDLMQRFGAVPWAAGTAGILESGSNLRRRIMLIRQFKPRSRWVAALGMCVCLILGLVTLTDAQAPQGTVDLVITEADIFGYTRPSYAPYKDSKMIAAQITNTGTRDVIVDVEFYEGDPAQGGKRIGRGGLPVPAGQTATETIPWPVKNGYYVIYALVDPDNAVTEQCEVNNLATRHIAYENGRFVNHGDADSRFAERLKQWEKEQPKGRRPLKRTEVSAKQAHLRASCQNNLKQMGIVFKMFANETRGEVFPLLSNEPGKLMLAWGGDDIRRGQQETILTTEFLTQPRILSCPASGEPLNPPDDRDYVYLGYVVRNDADIEAFARAYRQRLKQGGGFQTDLKITEEDKTILRLREGVERFYITDINSPAASAQAQSEIPVLIEWPDKHEVDGERGGTVLYMDGHVSFVPYPSKWPMTKKTMDILCGLAGRDPIE